MLNGFQGSENVYQSSEYGDLTGGILHQTTQPRSKTDYNALARKHLVKPEDRGGGAEVEQFSDRKSTNRLRELAKLRRAAMKASESNNFNLRSVQSKLNEQSIFLYPLICKTIANLIKVTEVVTSRCLQNMIQIILKSLISKITLKNAEKWKARLNRDEAEHLAVEKFSGIAGEYS